MTSAYLRHPNHGPLPAILLLLTVGTGLVDAASLLALGTVFVANMTGNVVFIGFALTGAPGFSLLGSVVALAGFLVGAVVGGALIARRAHRGRLLRDTLVVEWVLFFVALGIVIAANGTPGQALQVIILALAAVALGLQNAAVRALAVPDLTTTVLTMTLTGIGADLRRRDGATALRRLLAVAAMLLGAAIGALLVLRVSLIAGIAAEVLVLTAATVWTTLAARGRREWHGAA